MAVVAPAAAALLNGDWLQVNPQVSVQIPDQVEVDVVAKNGLVSVTFAQPLPLSVTESWGPFKGKFKGTVQCVLEVSKTGAQLVLGSLPDQVLEWAP